MNANTIAALAVVGGYMLSRSAKNEGDMYRGVAVTFAGAGYLVSSALLSAASKALK